VSRREKLRRRGRIIGQAAIGVVVTGLTAMWTVQIIRQVYPSRPETPRLQCRPALRDLIHAVRAARSAAASETGGERAAVKRFRAALGPSWQARAQLTEACQADPEALRALREVDLLRYAEEHAVRYEVQELALRRRRVRTLEKTLFGAPATLPPPGPSASAVLPTPIAP
jgi:hypothetical protein